MRVILLSTRIYPLRYDVHIIYVMSTYLWCKILYFCIMSILCILLMNGAENLFWLCTWRSFFSMSVRQPYVEPGVSWQFVFGHVSIGTSLRQSYFEPTGSWWLDFGTPGSWLVSIQVIPSPWLIVVLVMGLNVLMESHLVLIMNIISIMLVYPLMI